MFPFSSVTAGARGDPLILEVIGSSLFRSVRLFSELSNAILQTGKNLSVRQKLLWNVVSREKKPGAVTEPWLNSW